MSILAGSAFVKVSKRLCNFDQNRPISFVDRILTKFFDFCRLSVYFETKRFDLQIIYVSTWSKHQRRHMHRDTVRTSTCILGAWLMFVYLRKWHHLFGDSYVSRQIYWGFLEYSGYVIIGSAWVMPEGNPVFLSLTRGSCRYLVTKFKSNIYILSFS